MEKSSITLIRRCLILSTIALASGCSSINQMPHVNATDRRMAVATEKTVQISDSSIPTETSSPTKLDDSELKPLPKEESDEPEVKQISKVVNFIAERFKVSIDHASYIVGLATLNSSSDFPTRNDILAIIAVESRYAVKAVHRGSYGLMQIEKKSHLKKLQGRSVLDPKVNIELGAEILREYFKLTSNNRMAAILSYNAGIGNYQKKRYRLKYYADVTKEFRDLPR